MRLQVVGASHHNASVQIRERLAFSPDQAGEALDRWRVQFPQTEAVLLSTCNRVELYIAAEDPMLGPTHEDVAEFMARCHGLRLEEVFDDLFQRTGEDAVRHLFTVAASLDSMVIGEPQILSQVKQAYDLAKVRESVGPLTHAIFQASMTVAKRVASETAVNERRVSIPSVAVGDLATQIFERFDDKQILVIGAGEMAEETLVYLRERGASSVSVINRSAERATQLAEKMGGEAKPWDALHAELVAADLVISTTGATQPIVTAEEFRTIDPEREQRPLFVLDLAIPRDFEPAVADFHNVYLYCIDDLELVCRENRRQREKELPHALHVIEQETARFMGELHHRATGPIIRRLREGWQKPKEEELERLYRKLVHLEDRDREEIARSFDRLINKLLHPPLDSLKAEARAGSHHGLLDALKRLFKLSD